MPTPDQSELTGYILCEMMTGANVRTLCQSLDIRVPQGSRKDSSRQLASQIPLSVVATFCRNRWERPATEVHFSNLKSGLLVGHSWHRLAPSRLHLGLQNKVRQVARGELALTEFLSIGADIARKEYVMVAIADLTEVALVERCGATPPLKAKSLSDVVLRDIPLDVKNGPIPNSWTANRIRRTPAGFARAMYEGADSDRERLQATRAFNSWGRNRMFVCIEHESRWLSEPESVLDDLAAAVTGLAQPIEIKTPAGPFLAYVVVI